VTAAPHAPDGERVATTLDRRMLLVTAEQWRNSAKEAKALERRDDDAK
jgi:hypothetical protein